MFFPANLAGTGTNQTVDKAEEKEEQVLQERTVTDEQIQNEEIAKNEENKTIKEQEEGNKRVIDDVFYKLS